MYLSFSWSLIATASASQREGDGINPKVGTMKFASAAWSVYPQNTFTAMHDNVFGVNITKAARLQNDKKTKGQSNLLTNFLQTCHRPFYSGEEYKNIYISPLYILLKVFGAR